MAITIIVRNNTTSKIYIDDLGIDLDASEVRNLTETFRKEMLYASDDLIDLVSSGDLDVNDGTQYLSISEGLEHLQLMSLDQIRKRQIDDLADVPTKPIGSGEKVLQTDNGINQWVDKPPVINSIDDISGIPEVPTTGDEYLRDYDGLFMWTPSPAVSAMVQARRSTQYSEIPLVWTDFQFDNVDVETHDSVLEFDTITNARILIKEDGLYQIGYHFDVDDQVTTRVRVDDTTILPGSERFYGSETYETNFQGTCANVFYAYITAGSFITLQIMSATTAEYILPQATMIITKLEGITGPPGPAGGILTIEENSIEISNLVNTLNFIGGVSITEDSTSQVTIDVSGLPTELPCVEVLRTIQYDCTTTFVDITFDVTEVESHPTEIYHDDTNTDRIYAVDSGLYCVYYKTQIQSSGSTRRSEARVRINDNDVITSSQGFLNSYQNEIHHMTDIFTVDLAAGDYITLQIRSTTTPVVTFPPTVLGIFKLKGSKGDKGDKGDKGEPGAGGSPNILKNDSVVVANATDINFEGLNITVVDEGSNKATITVTEGSYEPKVIQCVNEDNYNINVDTPIRIDWTTESYKDSDYYTHSNASNPSRIYATNAGLYKVTYTVNYNGDNSRKNVRTRLRINGTTYETVGTAYSYTRTTTDNSGSNVASFLIPLTAGQYFEIMSDRQGSSGTGSLISDESWVIVEFIK